MTPEQKRTQSAFSNSDHADSVVTIPYTTDNLSDIGSLIEPYRQELYLHCYRFLGSLHDAEDLVQETMLRAWQHFDTFKGAASLRTWLYSVATHACLDVLKKRSSRTLPVVGYPVAEPSGTLPLPNSEVLWLEPFPNTWLDKATYDPEAHYTKCESVSLAFLTALQLLPPRQRAILILSDVLDWRANEVAHLLGISVLAVNSALHRSRVTLAKNYQRDERKMAQVNETDPATNVLLQRYMHAWETDDVVGLVALLKEDATLSMPPFTSWYKGREAIQSMLSLAAFDARKPRQWRLSLTGANGQPAYVLYREQKAKGVYQAFGIQLVTLNDAQIIEITSLMTPTLLPFFDHFLHVF